MKNNRNSLALTSGNKTSNTVRSDFSMFTLKLDGFKPSSSGFSEAFALSHAISFELRTGNVVRGGRSAQFVAKNQEPTSIELRCDRMVFPSVRPLYPSRKNFSGVLKSDRPDK